MIATFLSKKKKNTFFLKIRNFVVHKIHYICGCDITGTTVSIIIPGTVHL